MEGARTKVEQNASDELNQLVVFRLGKEEFGVFINQVQEIVRFLPVTPLPRVAAFVEGIVNLRGNIVPLIALRKKFNMDVVEQTKDTRVIVVNVEGTMIGMIVDSVSEVLRIAKNSIEPPPPLVSNVDSEFIQGVVNINKRLIILLELKRVITKEERKALQAIT